MSECTLTPQARAFSSVMSAFIGSIVNGLTSGALVAFITAWITWFALFRVVIGGSYMFYRSATGTWTPEPGSDEYEMLNISNHEFNSQNVETGQFLPTSIPPMLSELPAACDTEEYHLHVYISVFGQDGSLVVRHPKESSFSTIWPTRSDIAARYENARLAQQKRTELRSYYASDKDMDRALAAFTRMSTKGSLPGPAPSIAVWDAPNRDVTFLGWIGWIYGAIYSLCSQIIWVAANTSVSRYSGATKLVKGISIAVTALPLCFDTRVRFAESLREKRWGGTWAYYAFNLTNATSCLLQGILSGTLLIMGVLDMQRPTKKDPWPSFPTPILAIYPIFAIVWAWGSFKFVPIRDGGLRRAAQKHWTGYFLDIGMGVFSGAFVAAPAFALFMWTSGPGKDSSGASDLGTFLRCKVPSWQKFSAIFP